MERSRPTTHLIAVKILAMNNEATITMSGEDVFFPALSFPKIHHFFRNFFSSSVLKPIEAIEGDENVKDMLEYQKGDKQAFLRIYNRNKKKVYTWAYRMLSNEATAEEISQEVFIRIYKLQKTYKPLAKFTTLLYTITSRLVFNESRRKSRHPEDGIESEAWQNIPDVSNEWMNAMENEQKKEILERAILKVSKRQRAILMLRYIDGLSHDEIGQIMELKVTAIKSLLHRGLVSLANVLKEEGVKIQ